MAIPVLLTFRSRSFLLRYASAFMQVTSQSHACMILTLQRVTAAIPAAATAFGISDYSFLHYTILTIMQSCCL
jgi:hypothetical protein